MTRAERSSSTACKLAWAFALLWCALAPLALSRGEAATAHPNAAEWPSTWQGRTLRPLALSEVEQRFAARFPGNIARLTDGEQVLVWREVHRPTRMLHPAADCYRGLGYRIAQARLEHDAKQQLWRCFVAEREGQRLRVCERIVGADGRSFTDTSGWFWAAQLGQSVGPWQAITVARAM
ncbi:hypothetical protein BURC_00116 [Burkholderiaceae bacterium]|nr:hypothetical protein BURC_00116 [Burkholderiaceae bacterium]